MCFSRCYDTHNLSMIFGKDFDEMFSYTSRMLMCMIMDMAMPMPMLFRVHLQPTDCKQEAHFAH